MSNERPHCRFCLATAAVLTAGLALPQLASSASYTWNVPSGDWSTPTSWNPTTVATNGPLATDTAIFSSTEASSSSTTVNNTVDTNFPGAISNLTYNSVFPSANAALYNVTQIPAGMTLTASGAVLIGGLNEGAGGYTTYTYFTGGGTFKITGGLTVQNYGSASGANAAAYLNLSNLSTFIYSNSVGTVSIGDNPGSLTRLGGNLVLATNSNSITAENFNIATSTSAQAGPLCTLVFGANTNVLNVATINIANNKNSATLSFPGAGAGLKIRGVSGADTDRPNIIIGNRSVNGGTGTTTGTVLLNSNRVDIKANTLAVGENIGATASTYGVGVLQFDTGTIDTTTLLMANAPSAGDSTSTLTVGPNANLIVGAGGLSLVGQSAAGASVGNLIISNGTVTCNGNISNNTALGSNAITFATGGKLIMGANSYAGTMADPIGGLNLTTNTTLQLDVPLATQTNMVVNSLLWPNDDSALTIDIAGLPANLTIGSTIPLLHYSAISGGTFTAPNLELPVGVTGTLSISGNTLILTITGGVGPGTGGVEQLSDPGFESPTAEMGWTSTGTTAVTTVGTATYANSPSGPCPDAQPELVVSHSGTNVASVSSRGAGPSTNSLSQTVPVVGSSTLAAGAFTYVSHEDILTGDSSFYYEVDFLDVNGNVLASYQSYIVSNLVCGETTPFAVDSWNYLPVTNQVAVNTDTVIGTVPTGILMAPPGSANARFSAVLTDDSGTGTGSVYFDDINLGEVTGAVPPVISTLSPNLVTLCTNTNVTCTVSSTVAAITNVEVIVEQTTLGSQTITTSTNGLGSSSLSVMGLGTTNAVVSYALMSNTMYPSIVVKATDADGITVTSAADTLDTLSPTLVIEGSDFNFSGGQFIDTPPNGGLALYVNTVGVQGIDENKTPRTSTKAYYRPNDAVVLQAANPQLGTPPSATEEKFVTAAATGDTNDIELEVGYNSSGDWLDYTRTYGAGGSAPAGVYNVWCYLATDGTGVQSSMALVNGSATSANQATINLGTIGTSSFSDTGWNNYVYVPLVDQYGNLKPVQLSGEETLRNTIVGNPNISFYILTPALTPVVVSSYPDGSEMFQQTNSFSFMVSPGNGAPIASNGISLLINGVNVTSGLTLTQAGSDWDASYSLQPNMPYLAVVQLTNTSGLSSSFSISFDTFNATNYQWEAEDYDYSTNNGIVWIGGQYIDNPVPTGDAGGINGGDLILETNSYFCYPADFTPVTDPQGYGAIAQQGIDVNYPTTSGLQSNYRADTVGTAVAQDVLRPKFIASQQIYGDTNITDFYLGWFDTGYWANYTRDWPSNNFNVYGRLAGGDGAFSNTVLSVLTSGYGTTNQTTNVLGTFADPNAAGWYAWHWIPLMGTNGSLAVVSLGGKATLKLTSGGGLNVNCFMLVPAAMEEPQFSVSASLASGQIALAIPTMAGHTYTLMYSPSLTSTNWTQVGSVIVGDGATQVVSEPVSGQQGYYRVQVQ